MSLQVWLPLNGSLENLGLADVGEIDTTHISFTDNGKIGKCLTGYTGYFNIPSMTGKKQLSVAYWIRINTATSTQWLDAFRWYSTDGSSSYASRNEFYNDCINTGFWFKGGSISGKTTTVGDWHHHAFTIDYETGTAEFYIDGASVGSSSVVDITHYLTGTNFMIGENGLDTSHNDVRIYDHILSEKEVKELSKGLVAHYPLNDFSINPNETIIYDCSGYGHNGTLSPTPPVAATDSARYLTCMEFNGSNNYIDLEKDAWLPTDQITVSMWAYMDTWSNTRLISCTESGGFNFEQGSGGGFRFPVYKSGTGYMYGTPVKKWADYSPGWHFIVGTFDGYVSKIYIDGEYDCGSATSDAKAPIGYNISAKLFIGCEAATANPSAPYFKGKISDVRIYCTALSAEDIKALYETSVSIDDKGNFHAYEISEV